MDLRKKDQISAQLSHEIKNSQNHQTILYGPSFANQNTFVHPPELQALTSFTGSRQQKQVASQTKVQQLLKLNSDYRKRIKELKCDVALKDTEVQNLQRTLKFTKLKEFEAEL